MKRFVGLLLLAGLFTSSSLLSFAEQSDIINDITTNPSLETEDISSKYVGTTRTSYWEHTYSNPKSTTVGSWELFYSGAKAARDGEYDTVTCSKEYSHSYSGTIGGDIKKVQASIGYTFGTSESFSVSKNSSALKKGESVKAYWIKNYDVSTITSSETINIVGYELGGGGQYHPVNRSERGKTCTATANKAIMPQIKLEYYDSKGNKKSPDQELNRTEYYEYIDGDYKLVETEFETDIQ